MTQTPFINAEQAYKTGFDFSPWGGIEGFLRASQAKPGAIFSVIQVAVVLTLMLAAYKVSDYCFGVLNITEPKDIVLFRRVWLLIWAVSMVASIQIFLDIRRMSMPAPEQRPPARPVTQSSQRPTPRPPTRRR